MSSLKWETVTDAGFGGTSKGSVLVEENVVKFQGVLRPNKNDDKLPPFVSIRAILNENKMQNIGDYRGVGGNNNFF